MEFHAAVEYILPERCFTEGTPDEFARFISEKTGKEITVKNNFSDRRKE